MIFHWCPSPWELTEALLTVILSHCLYKETNYWGPTSLCRGHLRLSQIISPECGTEGTPTDPPVQPQWSLSESISARWEGLAQPLTCQGSCCHPAELPLHSQNDCVSFLSTLQSILPLRVPVQSRAPPCSLRIRARAHCPLCCVYRYHRLASWVLPPNYTLSLNQPVWFLFPLYLRRSLTLSPHFIPSINAQWCLDVIRQLFKEWLAVD